MAENEEKKPAADDLQGQRPDQSNPEPAPAAPTPEDINDPQAYWKAHYEKQDRLEKKRLADELATLKAEDEARKRTELEEQGKFQDIIKDLEPKAERAARLEDVVKVNLDREMASIPEQFRGLIPDGDVATRLEWVLGAKESGLFGAPKAPPTDAGVQGDSPKSAKLSAEEVEFAHKMGLGTTEYAAMKDPVYDMKDIHNG